MNVVLEPLADPDDLTDHGVVRTFLAPCLLVAAAVLSLAGISVAAGNRMAAAAPPACARISSPPPRPTCP